MSKNISYDKQWYRDWCAVNQIVPVFFQDWWLDLVCGEDGWEVILYIEDPQIVAVMPYCLKKKTFFSYITMPLLTKFMGPFFIRRFDERKEQSILVKMVDALPLFSRFTQTLHYQIQNWLPYKWKGFKQTAYYSYCLRNIRDRELTWLNIDADYRNNKIAKIADFISVKEDLDFETLYKLTVEPFQRQKVKMPVPSEFLAKVVDKVYEKGCGKSLYAIDGQNNVLAAVLLIWDRKSCYLLLAGENDQSRKSGTGIYLTWKAIEYASEKLAVNSFDFLGGMAENLERTRRQFGAEQVPYFLISKDRGLFKLFRSLG